MAEEEILIEFELPDPSRISDDGLWLEFGAAFSAKGDKWEIHKYDPDDLFPSDFHAHKLRGREKLDMYTGAIYSAQTKDIIERLPKKVMLYLYKTKFSRSKDLKDRFADQSKFVYLN